nr:hypothetical protein [Tanacetum cinerariifolium]
MDKVAKINDPQCDLLLLRACIGISKLYFVMRTCPPRFFESAQCSFDVALRSALERIVTASGPGFGDWQWRLATLPFAFRGLDVYCAGNVLNYAFLASRLQSAGLQTKLLRHAGIFYSGPNFDDAMALWKSQMEDHTSDWFRVVLISGLGQTINGCLLEILMEIIGKEIDIGLDGRRDVCMDLIGSSPLTQTEMADFVPGRVVIDAAQRKRVKYEAKWSASFNQPKNQKPGLVEPKSSPVMVFTCEGHLHLNFTRDGKTWSKDSDKPKSNNVVGPSVINMVKHNNSSRYNDNKGKRKHHDNTKVDPNKKAKLLVGNVAKLVTLKGIAKAYYVTYVSEAYFVHDDDVVWWVDSGATIHVCKDRYLFKTYESLNDGSILHMGNESTALVHGRGCVDLRLNIVNDNIGSAFMSTSKLNDSILWHARLGHVHFKRMQDMSKDGLIPAFDMDTEKWNKKYFVTFIDDASRFCYVYLLHSKDEALDKFKVFKTKVELQKGSLIKRFRTDMGGCREIVRLVDPKLKTLSERGIECIFVGYAEHFKAFRFYVIEHNESVVINSIIESMDDIFDENRLSSVSRPNLMIPNGTEDIGGLVVPEEITEEVDGTIEKFKAMLVIQGFKQKSGIDYFDTYAPVVRINIIRPLIAMASIHNLIIHHMDVNMAFLNGELDEEVYMNQPQGFIMPGNENKVDLIKEFLSSRFSMKDMGEVDVILCIRIKHEMSTHMDTSEKLMPNNGQVVSQLEYSRVIGCLMYAMNCTRPNIVIIVGKLSRLTYSGYPSVLEGYTDANWLSNTKDNSSTSGSVFLLEGGAISCASKKQTCITGSTMESEFVALAAACKEAE